MNPETRDQEMPSAGGRAELELKSRLLAVRRRKLAIGERTPAIEAVRLRLLAERREERES